MTDSFEWINWPPALPAQEGVKAWRVERLLEDGSTLVESMSPDGTFYRTLDPSPEGSYIVSWTADDKGRTYFQMVDRPEAP